MSLQDDYFDLSAELKGEQKRQFTRIWKAFCDVETEVEESRECVRFVNAHRVLLADKPPLYYDRDKRELTVKKK